MCFYLTNVPIDSPRAIFIKLPVLFFLQLIAPHSIMVKRIKTKEEQLAEAIEDENYEKAGELQNELNKQ